MPFKKGDPNINRLGRTLGGKTDGKTKYRRITDAQRKMLAEQAGGITPLQMLISVMRDETTIMDARIDAAKAAAPYMHRKMPIAIEDETKTNVFRFDTAMLRKLSDVEIKQLVRLLTKMGITSEAKQEAPALPGTTPPTLSRAKDAVRARAALAAANEDHDE